MLRHVWARCCAERAHIRDCHTSACLTPREASQFIALAGSSWEWHWMRGCPVHVWRLGHLSWPAAEHLPVAPAANSLTLGLHGSFLGAGTTEQSKQSMSAASNQAWLLAHLVWKGKVVPHCSVAPRSLRGCCVAGGLEYRLRRGSRPPWMLL